MISRGNFTLLSQNVNSIGTLVSDDKLTLKINAILGEYADITLIQDLRLNTSAGNEKLANFTKHLETSSRSLNIKKLNYEIHSPFSARGVGIIYNPDKITNVKAVYR